MFGPSFRNPHDNPQWAIRNRPQGLTLVEMLIGMAITLVMMAAVVNLFANLGAGVRVRRAHMELGSQLRIARAKLFSDLAGATCPAKPWRVPGHEEGYIEIIDGQWSDSNPSILTNGNTNDLGELDYATSLVPSSNLPLPPGDVTDGGGLGDHDCVLALTVRSDSEPFVGRFAVWNTTTNQWDATTIQSPVAEVIWYVVENPSDGSLGEPGMRTLYRRVLLITPWVALQTLSSLPGATVDEKILTYYRNNDISTQIYKVGSNGNLVPRGYQPDLTPDLNVTENLVPNSLGDLTKRENRFAHTNRISGGTAIPWPYIMDQNTIRLLPYDANDTSRTEMISPLRPFGRPFEPTGATPDRTGQDLMLNDVLAWDLRVFDPGAPLVEINGTVLEPSDPGWDPEPGNIVGFGAYVNLGWDPTSFGGWTQRYYPATDFPTTPPTPLFKEPHTPGWHPRDPTGTGYGYWAVYDTWSEHYESDGLDQDGYNGVDQGRNKLDDVDPTFAAPIDQITPADQAVNGVDDPLERETSPPYDVPLRGMQVKIRVYERDSRQIREATVTRNFVE